MLLLFGPLEGQRISSGMYNYHQSIYCYLERAGTDL